MKKTSILILVLFSLLFSTQKTVIKIEATIRERNSAPEIKNKIETCGDEEIIKGMSVTSEVFINDSLASFTAAFDL